jgi:hypothetical protein
LLKIGPVVLVAVGEIDENRCHHIAVAAQVIESMRQRSGGCAILQNTRALPAPVGELNKVRPAFRIANSVSVANIDRSHLSVECALLLELPMKRLPRGPQHRQLLHNSSLLQFHRVNARVQRRQPGAHVCRRSGSAGGH